jgi:hypothetical protein
MTETTTTLSTVATELRILSENQNTDEPEPKKIKIEAPRKNLEERLCDILVCTVCLDDSKASIYQVFAIALLLNTA